MGNKNSSIDKFFKLYNKLDSKNNYELVRAGAHIVVKLNFGLNLKKLSNKNCFLWDDISLDEALNSYTEVNDIEFLFYAVGKNDKFIKYKIQSAITEITSFYKNKGIKCKVEFITNTDKKYGVEYCWIDEDYILQDIDIINKNLQEQINFKQIGKKVRLNG